MSSGSSSTMTAPLPMAPLSAPWMHQQGIAGATPVAPTTAYSPNTPASKASISVQDTALEITIVTTEEVPAAGKDGMPSSSSTTTIERKLKLRLALPPSYATKQIKSLNVKLHQNVPTSTTSSMASSCYEPTPVTSLADAATSMIPGFHKGFCNEVGATTETAPQFCHPQKALHHIYQEQNQPVLPTTVGSSQDVISSDNRTDFSPPLPETVSSSSLPTVARQHRNGSIKRRLSARPEAVLSNESSLTESRRTKRTRTQ